MKYIDSSAFVKYYADESAEKGSAATSSLLDRAKEGKEKLIASILLIGECASVFDKWLRLKKIDIEERDKMIGDFISDIKELTEKESLQLEAITILAVMFSIDHITRHHLTVNDALHLHSAMIHKDKINQFICCDKNLLQAAGKEGLKTWNPEEN